jgi:hypothetical protein
MDVELLDDKKLWDQFVEHSPQGTLFHKWDLLKIVERHSSSSFCRSDVYPFFYYSTPRTDVNELSARGLTNSLLRTRF